MAENVEITMWRSKEDMLKDISEETGVDIEDIEVRTVATIKP